MNTLKTVIAALIFSCSIMSCMDQGAQQGESTPIDSTNIEGTAPATYGGDDPADDAQKQTNTGDTGTKATNTSNSGYPENTVKPDAYEQEHGKNK
jgi:hypothetical protein